MPSWTLHAALEIDEFQALHFSLSLCKRQVFRQTVLPSLLAGNKNVSWTVNTGA